MTNLKSCIICKCEKLTDNFRCEDFTTTHEIFTLRKCENCGFQFTDPQPSESEIGKYYLSENYISHTGAKRNLFEIIYHVARRFALKSKSNIIRKKSTGNKLLDYGCGTGEFLAEMKKYSWQTNGVEPSSIANLKASEITKEKIFTNISQITSKENYDVITLWHVLEHLHNPNEILLHLRESLKKNGLIIIAVPNFESYDAKYYKYNWAAYDVPRHLWHFSKPNIKSLLENNGLIVSEILPMTLDSYYVSLLSESYKKKTQPKPFIILTALFVGFISNLKARKNNNYSSLIYLAKKK